MPQQNPQTPMIFMDSTSLPAARTGVLTPFNPGQQILPIGYQVAPQFKPLPVEIILDKDVEVTLRDGTVIHTDIFRPNTDEEVPAIVSWSPYGKGQGSSASVMGVFALVGLENSIVSGLEKFEGADPAFWCAQGYAVCHPDPRGCIDSEGNSVLWDRQEGEDCHDVIEWLAEQEWCNGKIGMSGTSYLAASQWFTAAEQPEHLAAINPWEGISDTYRDLALRGGMPDTGFAALLQEGSFFGKNQKENIVAEVAEYPTINDFWKNKIPAVERINVPAYVVASYTNTLHTPGTFRAWRQLNRENSWLRIHASQEWPDYYAEENQADLLRFFDHYLKGIDNNWEKTPKVRYSLLDVHGNHETNIPAEQFPPADVENTVFYLDGASRQLSSTPAEAEKSVEYSLEQGPGFASFTHIFKEDTQLVGYPKAHLTMEVKDADDMDVFIYLQKLDENGTPLQEFTVPNRNAMLHDVTENDGTVLRFKGADGRLRASMRHLDSEKSTDEVPEHTFDRIEKLSVGEVVELDIALAPVGLTFKAGEQMRFIASAKNLFGAWMPNAKRYESSLGGTHVLHTGGTGQSFIQLPVMR